MAHILFVDTNMPGMQMMAHAKKLGHHVTFIRGTSYMMYAQTPANQAILASLDHIFDMPVTSDVPKVLQVGLELAKHTHFDAVITLQDYATEATAALGQAFGLPFLSPTAVFNARCKEQTRFLLDKAGIPSARYATADSIQDAQDAASRIGLPVVVKPSSGADSILAARCDTLEQVAVATSAILNTRGQLPEQIREQLSRGILVEEHLSGPLVSAEIAIQGDKVVRYMISGRVRGEVDETIEIGAAMPANIPEELREQCFKYAETVSQALAFDFGFVHLEMIVTDRGPILVEANARLMGGIMPKLFEVVTQHSILGDLLSLHLGHGLQTPPLPLHHATSRKIMVAADGVINQYLDLSSLAHIADDLDVFDAPGIIAAAPVRRHNIIGRLVASANSMAAADTLADATLQKISRLLGVGLVR